MSAKSGRSILRSLYEPALKGIATASKVLVCDANTNITGLTLTTPTIVGLVIDGATISDVYDGSFAIVNSSDITKAIEFSAAGNTTGVVTTLASSSTGTATLTLPAATSTLVSRISVDTLTNKTLTSPTITDQINQDYVTATGSFTKTSTTTLAAVTGLSLNLTAAGTYVVRGHLIGTAGSSGGISAEFIATNSLTLTSGTITAFNYNGTTLNYVTNITAVSSDFGGGNAAYTDLIFEGSIIVNAAGTLGISAAQHTSSTTATTITNGSYLSVVRVS